MKGFRVPPSPNKKDQLRQVETELKNLQMASRVSQMMVQQLMNSVKTMSDDLGSALNQLMELQYKYSAIRKHLDLPVEALDLIANEQRLVDFNAGAASQDVKDGLVVAEEVGPDSTITLTTVAKDETGNDRGIFRSRLKLSECGVPALISALAGKKVGDKVECKLNNADHVVELLSIRNPGQPVEEVPQLQNVAVDVAAEASH